MDQLWQTVWMVEHAHQIVNVSLDVALQSMTIGKLYMEEHPTIIVILLRILMEHLHHAWELIKFVLQFRRAFGWGNFSMQLTILKSHQCRITIIIGMDLPTIMLKTIISAIILEIYRNQQAFKFHWWLLLSLHWFCLIDLKKLN